MERMRNPLNAVMSQRDSEFEGYADGGGAGKHPAALSPMSTGDSEGSDETDVGAERPTPNGTIEQRNLNPPDWNGGWSGRMGNEIGSTLPMVNGDSSSVFNRTIEGIDPMDEGSGNSVHNGELFLGKVSIKNYKQYYFYSLLLPPTTFYSLPPSFYFCTISISSNKMQ